MKFFSDEIVILTKCVFLKGRNFFRNRLGGYQNGFRRRFLQDQDFLMSTTSTTLAPVPDRPEEIVEAVDEDEEEEEEMREKDSIGSQVNHFLDLLSTQLKKYIFFVLPQDQRQPTVIVIQQPAPGPAPGNGWYNPQSMGYGQQGNFPYNNQV